MLSGCGTFKVSNGIYAPSYLIDYIDDYLDDKEKFYGYKEVNYPIFFSFSKLKKPVIANCSTVIVKGYGETFKKHIKIDIDFWNRSDYCEVKLVIYHELGHCDLSLSHNNTSLMIMNSNKNSITDSFCKDDSNYIEQFFKSVE